MNENALSPDFVQTLRELAERRKEAAEILEDVEVAPPGHTFGNAAIALKMVEGVDAVMEMVALRTGESV